VGPRASQDVGKMSKNLAPTTIRTSDHPVHSIVAISTFHGLEYICKVSNRCTSNIYKTIQFISRTVFWELIHYSLVEILPLFQENHENPIFHNSIIIIQLFKLHI